MENSVMCFTIKKQDLKKKKTIGKLCRIFPNLALLPSLIAILKMPVHFVLESDFSTHLCFACAQNSGCTRAAAAFIRLTKHLSMSKAKDVG